MNVFECQHCFGNVQSSHIFVERTHCCEQGGQISTGQVLHDEIEVAFVLKAHGQTHHERILRHGENVALGKHSRHRVLALHARLFEHFDRVDVARRLLARHVHAAVGAARNRLDDVERVDADWLVDVVGAVVIIFM